MRYTVVKTDYGFEYCVAKLVIARGEFVKRKGKWLLRMWHMEPTQTKVGLAALRPKAEVEVSEVFNYLNTLIYPD